MASPLASPAAQASRARRAGGSPVAAPSPAPPQHGGRGRRGRRGGRGARGAAARPALHSPADSSLQKRHTHAAIRELEYLCLVACSCRTTPDLRGLAIGSQSGGLPQRPMRSVRVTAPTCTEVLAHSAASGDARRQEGHRRMTQGRRGQRCLPTARRCAASAGSCHGAGRRLAPSAPGWSPPPA
jgi:hypothetical protein